MPGLWEEGSLGWMNLGDVEGGRNERGGWGCFVVMQVGLGLTWG